MSLRQSGMLSLTQNKKDIPSQGILRQDAYTKMKCLIDTLQNAGLHLKFTDDPHVLTQEQSLVVRDLEKILAEGGNIEEFCKGLKLLCSKHKHFRAALLHTQFKKSDGDSDVKIEQESAIRLLLKVSSLQEVVIGIILEEIANTAGEDSEDTSWLRLLLQPLRYLPQIKNPTTLSTKLLDILDISTYTSQLEIIDSIPEILPDNQYSEITKQLCRLLDENDNLAGAIIDCLNALQLDSEVRCQVQEKILGKLSSGTCRKIFPILLEFLLTECKSNDLLGTLQQIRNALDTVMCSSEKDKEKESTKVLIFNKLQMYAITPRTVSEAWLNMFAGMKNASDHKPVDLLILFMLHSSAKQKKGIIEAIFRKRVRDGQLKASLLEKMFEKYITQQLLRDYFQSILDIGCSLLRTTNEPVVIHFATTLFKSLFSHRYTDAIYRRELLDSLILLTGSNDQKNIAAILQIFSDLLNDIAKMQQHTLLLMRLLERLDSFELKDVKAVFEILCTLTCGEKADESLSGLRDEIHMIVRKQLSSSKRCIKHKGIISAVVMAKHIVLTTEEQSDMSLSEDSMSSLTNLPQGQAKDAATLLELTSTCSSRCPELMGLYYDQLAYMLVTKDKLNKDFMTWLYKTVTNDFESIYVTEHVMDSMNDLQFSMQYSLNTEEEIDTPIAINIAELTVKPKSPNEGSILILAPHFRMLRLLHYREHNGDLSNIDALLGCAVVLPNLEDIDMLDFDQIKQVADCVFHCINWFREIISGFVTQKSKTLRNKVIQRVQHVIELQNVLNTCMEHIPEHKLPISYFDSPSQPTKQSIVSSKKETKTKQPPKKKVKSAETVDIDDTIASTSGPVTKPSTSKKSKLAQEFKISFREMDTDVLVLLRYPLKYNDHIQNVTQSTQASPTTFLNIGQLEMILSDFVAKLNILTKGKNIGLSHLNIVVPLDIITDCILILPNVNKHLKVIHENLQKLLKEADGKLDSSELFTADVLQLKKCFGLILEIYSLIFSWSGFQNSKNLELLRQILQAVRASQHQTQQLNSANKLIIDFINQLSSYTDQCLALDHAVSLIKTMQALYSILNIPNIDVQKKIITVCGKLLSKRWYNQKGIIDSGKNCSANLDILIKSYLEGASIKTLCGLIGTLEKQACELKAKEDNLQMLPSIDKTHFYIFFRGFCNALQVRIKIELQSLTNTEHLVVWRNTVLSMQGLMAIVKAQETKTNLVCFLKKSIGILKVFLSHGIPILEIMLKSKPDEVVEIFKTMQTSTRFLHHLCCYSKLKKEACLMAFVPQFRLTLETLVYRVKATLVANNCSAAFWMGNLRNRDLHGEDILSQSTTTTESVENENSEEELPEDDSDEDILNSGANNNEDKSESLVFN